MAQFDLIEKFFYDKEDYISFLVNLKERITASDSGNCFAQLVKEDGYFVYTLLWHPTDQFIEENIKPFQASKENVDQFNEGCKIMAKQLRHYLETGDASIINENPTPFGNLTFVK